MYIDLNIDIDMIRYKYILYENIGRYKYGEILIDIK